MKFRAHQRTTQPTDRPTDRPTNRPTSSPENAENVEATDLHQSDLLLLLFFVIRLFIIASFVSSFTLPNKPPPLQAFVCVDRCLTHAQRKQSQPEMHRLATLVEGQVGRRRSGLACLRLFAPVLMLVIVLFCIYIFMVVLCIWAYGCGFEIHSCNSDSCCF